MSGSLSNKIDVSKFLAQMSNPDEDFAVIELDKLIKLLEKPPHEIFVTPNCDEWFLENILSRVYSKKIDLIDASFRSIVLLSQYYNVDKIRIIFRRILAISQENADIRPQLLSVLKEIFSNHSSYENSRNEEIFTYFFGECVRDMTLYLDDNLTFNIELISSLLENLGSLATEKQLTELIDKVLFFLKPERNKEIKPQMRSFSNLVKEWSKFAPQPLIERLVEFLLSENMKTTNISLTMLTSIVMTVQKPLLKFFDDLFALFYENSQIETESDNDDIEDENTEIDDETETGIIVDSESIKKVQFSVEALANLTHAFPQEASKELSKLFDIFYSHVNYNIVESGSIHTDDEDVGLKLEIDSDMEDSDNEMMDDDAGFDDEESWKIRKSAVRLGMVLLNAFPTEFFESLQNEGNEHNFTLSLDDTDPGAKKDILDLLTKIVKTYGNKISKANEWITIVSNSVKQTDQNCISCIIAISELAKIIDVTENQCVPNVFTGVHCPVSDLIDSAMIEFCRSLIIGPTKCTDEIISNICSQLDGIIKQGTIKNSNTSIELAALLYKISPISDSIKKLNETIYSCIETHPKTQNAIISFTCFYSIYKITDNRLIQILLKNLNEKYNIKKAALISIIMLVCSDNSGLLQPKISEFIDIIFNDIELGDQQIVHRSFLALNMMLTKGLADKSQIVKYIEKIYGASYRTDGKCKLTALDLLIQLADCDIYENYGDKLFISLCHSINTQELVNSCGLLISKIVANKNNADLINKTVNYVLNKYQEFSDEKLLQQIAYLIGSAATHSEEIAQTIFSFFDSNNTPLSLFSLGETLSVAKDEGDKYLNKIISMIDPSLPRSVFSPAASCLGMIASHNDRAFNLMISGEVKSFSLLLPAIFCCSMRVTDDNKIMRLVDFILEIKEVKRESQQLISDSLAALINAYSDKKLLLSKLIKISYEKSPISDTTALSLSIFSRNETTSENLSIIITDLLPMMNPSQPSLASHAVFFMKSSLRFADLQPTVIENIPLILECCKFDESQHVVYHEAAFGQVKEDISRAMRIVSIETVISLLNLKNVFSLKGYVDDCITTAINSIPDEDSEVKSRGLALLQKLCIDNRTRHFVVKRVKEIAAAFEKAHPMDDDSDIGDVAKPLFEAIAMVSLVTRGSSPCQELEMERERYENSDIMIKAENDAQAAFMMEEAKENSSDTRIDGTDYRLILVGFCKEAEYLFSK